MTVARPVYDLTAFTHTTGRTFRLDRLPICLDNPPAKPPRRTLSQPLKIRSNICATHLLQFLDFYHQAGLFSSRSKKPRSISLSCAEAPRFALPTLDSSRHSP